MWNYACWWQDDWFWVILVHSKLALSMMALLFWYDFFFKSPYAFIHFVSQFLHSNCHSSHHVLMNTFKNPSRRVTLGNMHSYTLLCIQSFQSLWNTHICNLPIHCHSLSLSFPHLSCSLARVRTHTHFIFVQLKCSVELAKVELFWCISRTRSKKIQKSNN